MLVFFVGFHFIALLDILLFLLWFLFLYFFILILFYWVLSNILSASKARAEREQYEVDVEHADQSA